MNRDAAERETRETVDFDAFDDGPDAVAETSGAGGTNVAADGGSRGDQ
jgi:hypothetical protein